LPFIDENEVPYHGYDKNGQPLNDCYNHNGKPKNGCNSKGMPIIKFDHNQIPEY
jgi:hypothetical protein